ncbi:MAG TPA: branched-chain amino acid ABC transporter substrate-binding protein [Thermodesulforhabdus norvegica]|uniref:Branched-chain amino acid ABC transporter substrate-binding protein n=1 Tax=Thermodesulforhabdus norvegica TaxID=39841 RepID=A0A7C0WTQ7_9BACT|nr:branched-chain amino acid ABC transporter substrate-binding protein [Deltaproteobacteria bacterium]MBW2067308.1 branched-chain amino acid ABC transporter substrate-binding protein [Deltaproteobacteria bacterium]HDL90453.1 branched-chain amino acid ABC transporter substrate-binding protein [Thermodesulforhabdus norvegica]
MRRFSWIVTFLAVLVFIFGSVISSTAGEIKVGLMGPMTGAWASEGQEMKQVLELLVEETNNQGGVNGQKIKLIVEDDGSDPRTAALAAQRLVTQGIVGVIGTYGSSVTEATQNIYDEAKVIQIANGSTAIRLTEKGLKYFFRTCPRDDEQARVAVKAIKNLGFHTIAILHDNTTYAKGLAEEAKRLLEKDDTVKIVFFDALTPGEQDYTAILTKLKGANPDAVFFTGYYPEAGLLLRQKKEMGWDVPFIGGDATNNPDLTKIAGADAAAGFYFVSAPLPKDLPGEEAKKFLEKFAKKYGNPPNSIYSVLAGDGFRVLVKAIEVTKSTDPDVLADYLHNKLKDFPGLTGKISFNEKGDRVGEVYRVYRVNEKGEFILLP